MGAGSGKDWHEPPQSRKALKNRKQTEAINKGRQEPSNAAKKKQKSKQQQTGAATYHVEIGWLSETGINLNQRLAVDGRGVRFQVHRDIYSSFVTLCRDIAVIGGDPQCYGRRHCIGDACFGFWFNFSKRGLANK